MTEQQKKYIEDNIELIENNRWEEFFQNPPHGTGGVLYEAGIDFMSELGYIPQHSFIESNIKTIDIPSNVKLIGYEAFSGCYNLTSVTLPTGLGAIGIAAFYYCPKLKTVNIPKNSQLFSIGSSAFDSCDSLENIVLPSGVKTIGDHAFWQCNNLTSVALEDNVKAIGDMAFADCGKHIDIKYSGTVDKWEQLIDDNSRVFSHTRYTCTCTDGIVKNS